MMSCVAFMCVLQVTDFVSTCFESQFLWMFFRLLIRFAALFSVGEASVNKGPPFCYTKLRANILLTHWQPNIDIPPELSSSSCIYFSLRVVSVIELKLVGTSGLHKKSRSVMLCYVIPTQGVFVLLRVALG